MQLSQFRPSNDVLHNKLPLDKLSFDKLSLDRLPLDRLPLDRHSFERLPFARHRPSLWKRVAAAGTPAWTIAVAAFAGLMAGVCLGMALSGRAATRSKRHGSGWRPDEIKSAWPEISDQDIEAARGDAARLAETIRARTGENADAVRVVLEGMARRDPAAN